jgi:Flp pilus assembly secretin CpaC
MSSTEEMEMAIENCKELVEKAQPHSDRHKNLVQKLIHLRMKLQEIKVGGSKVADLCQLQKVIILLSRGKNAESMTICTNV